MISGSGAWALATPRHDTSPTTASSPRAVQTSRSRTARDYPSSGTPPIRPVGRLGERPSRLSEARLEPRQLRVQLLLARVRRDERAARVLDRADQHQVVREAEGLDLHLVAILEVAVCARPRAGGARRACRE